MNFTEDQQKVIDSRNKNVLVAAAAGSGKTAVLVERIIERVRDKEHPIDIDRILVVTFTNAAASEMKERIRSAIEAASDAEPDNEHLRRQRSLIHAANIMTIDSFCRMIIRDNFDRVGMDPQFRIADESELSIMREDAMAEVLENEYTKAAEEDTDNFYEFLEQYSTSKDDSDIAEAVFKLFDYSRSKPDPEKWLESVAESYDIEDEESLINSEWMKHGIALIHDEISECVDKLDEAIRIASDAGGPYMYLDLLSTERDMIYNISAAEDYKAMQSYAAGVSFGRLSTKKDESVDAELREKVKGIRNGVKDRFQKVRAAFLSEDTEKILESIAASRPMMKCLVKLTLDFSEKFKELKGDKNIIDFSDLEHIALEILRTTVAEDYRNYFEEVMTDEYQDSNSIQESILTSVAKDNNYFCVGDVKQSIYSFRLAEPGIFMSRYAFSETDERSERIILAKNFRSRKEVLDSVNVVFDKIMHENVGGVEYDDAAALYYGASYSETGADHKAEMLIINADQNGEISKHALEARIVASRIKSMVGNYPVEDRKNGGTHPAQYRDFVILLRSLNGVDEVYREALEEAGIPAFIESRTGYFQTEEIRTLISFISVLDNPRQDIPLASVMTSVLGNFSDEDLAGIRTASPKGDYYTALLCASGRREPEEDASEITERLKEKSRAFLEMIERYREMVAYTPIHSLIETVISETGYDLYAMTKGGSARANIEMLIQKAADFEHTSYKGLFYFLRYIEKLKKYDMDFGEAMTGNEDADVVRIMSIHKSKGLEFPVVFLSGLSRKFNTRDLVDSIVMDSDLGVAMDRTDKSTRIKSSGFFKGIISEKRRRAAIGEELRVLYVAMTRAEEKLIMTAVVDDSEKVLSEVQKGILHSGSNLDFLAYAFTYEDVREKINIRTTDISELTVQAVEEAIELESERLKFSEIDPSIIYEEETAAKLDKNLNWKYEHESSFEVPVKVSVSRLKQAAMEEVPAVQIIEDEAAEAEEAESEEISEKTAAAQGGALRGTAYHKAFEMLTLEKIRTVKEAKAFIDELVENEMLEKDAAAKIWAKDLVTFGKTELAKRMYSAADRGELFKEQPFIIARKASDIDSRWPQDENVQIQGIIDAFFIENGKLYVVDYKTDRVESADTLAERYAVQLDLYADALSQIMGMEIGEKLIYSVALGEVVSLGGGAA